jgi:long-chain fatty acid transport protein
MGKKIIVVCFSLCLLTSGLWSGGWNNTLMGIRALGMGAAFVGIADDPSAIFYNPAGLILQEQRLNFSINGFYVMPTHEYALDGFSARSQENTSIPQFFFTYKASERLTLGFGAYAPYATGGMSWKREQLGTPFKSYLGIISFTPTLSYRVSDTFSFGLNLNIYYSKLDIKTENDAGAPLETKESGTTVSASVGFMFQPSEKWRVGLTVRGPASVTLTGTTTIRDTVPGFGPVQLDRDSETKFKLPWDIEFGISYLLSERVLISASAQYSMWSRLENVDKSIKDLPLVGDVFVKEVLNFSNIFILRTGFEYMFPAGVFLRGGVGMDRAAQPADTLTPINIDTDKFTVLCGIGYRTGNTQIDFVYLWANGQERERTNTDFGFPITERYNLSATILGLGVSFSF